MRASPASSSVARRPGPSRWWPAPNGLINGQPVPDEVGLSAARAGTPTFDELSVGGTPVRAYSQAVQLDGQTLVLQVVADRSTELQTLQTTLLVLLLGGVVVIAVAAALGWLYAGRALVPIRDSLRRQREFAADASHELRTPLTVIRGNVQLLEREGGLPATSREALTDIDAEVTRMTSLVEQLLLLARTDSDAVELDLSSCDLADEATDAISGFAPLAAERGVHLALDVSPAPLRGDALRLRQLCAILVDNAVQHAPADGHVTVSVASAAGRASLTVDDDGPGIRPEDLPRVFDRFWRASDAPEGGAGLGLAIAAWIVDRHGGRIRALERPGGGARFSVDLPGRSSTPSGAPRRGSSTTGGARLLADRVEGSRVQRRPVRAVERGARRGQDRGTLAGSTEGQDGPGRRVHARGRSGCRASAAGRAAHRERASLGT